MANGNAQHKSPNTAAPVSNVALKGSRRSDMVRKGNVESMADRNVNSKSSDNTANLAVQNQTRNQRQP